MPVGIQHLVDHVKLISTCILYSPHQAEVFNIHCGKRVVETKEMIASRDWQELVQHAENCEWVRGQTGKS